MRSVAGWAKQRLGHFFNHLRETTRPNTSTIFIADWIAAALPFGRIWYRELNAISNAIGYAQHRSRSHDAVIRVYGNVIKTHEHKGDFKEW